MRSWSNYTWIDVIKKFESNDINGLTSTEAEKRKEKYGPNTILKFEDINIFRFILSKIKKPWVGVLFLTSLFSIIQGVLVVGILALLMLIFYTLIDFKIQAKKLESLRIIDNINSQNVSVMRDGILKKLSIEEIVPGDIVFLEKGMVVPADLRIIESNVLKVKQASITGEDYLVEKYETRIEDEEISLIEMKNIAFKSSIVVEGSGTGIAVDTGMNTVVGNIFKVLSEKNEKHNESKLKWDKELDIISGIYILAAIIIFILTRNLRYISYLYLEVVPINCIMSIYLLVTAGRMYMSKNSIDINGFLTYELCSNIDSILVDKNDYITKNDMTAREFYTNLESKEFTDELEKDDNIERLLLISLLCNNYTNKKGKLSFELDIEDKALVELGKKYGMSKSMINSQYKRIFEIPYDEQKRMRTVINRIEDKYRASSKGAVEQIVQSCTHIMKNGVEVEITDEDIANIKNADIDMCNKGLNVSALAYRNFNYQPSISENIESYMVFVGMIALENPLNEDAQKAMELSKKFGISPIIITEDSKLSAISMGKSLNLKTTTENVLSGIEIENMEEKSFKKNIDKIKIFSRVTTAQKVKIIQSLKEKGKNICVPGSKLRDLPLLEEGYLSVASGDKSSIIIKSAADVIVNECSYMNILSLLNKSKLIIDTTIMVIKFLLLCNFSEAIYYIAYLLYFDAVPFKSPEIVFINVFLQSIMAIALFINIIKQDGFNYFKLGNIKRYILINLKLIVNSFKLGVIYFFVNFILNKFNFISFSVGALIIILGDFLLFMKLMKNDVISVLRRKDSTLG